LKYLHIKFRFSDKVELKIKEIKYNIPKNNIDIELEFKNAILNVKDIALFIENNYFENFKFICYSLEFQINYEHLNPSDFIFGIPK
jgi:hypothetical protein